MKVGVIGAGTMGSGIAQAFAQTEGYEVCLCDINEEFAANGKAKIAKRFRKTCCKRKNGTGNCRCYLSKDHNRCKRYLYRLRFNRRSSY